MKTLSCHLFGAGAYNIVRRRSQMKKFSFVKNFTNVKIYRKRFQKKPLSKNLKMFHVEQKRRNENENIISYI
jgi:hypothetical protein